MKRYLAVVAMVSSLATTAQAERLICQFPEDNRARGWVAPVVIFDVETADSVVVVDDVIMNHAGGPLYARARTNNNRRLTVTWDVDTSDRIGQRSRIRYTAFIQRGSLAVSMLAQPRGYQAFPRIAGQCRQEG